MPAPLTFAPMTWDRRRPGVLTAIASSALFALSACGGGGTPLSRADFTERANAACENLQEASDTLVTAQGEALIGEQLANRVSEAADGLAVFAEELDEPEPPTILADRVETLVGQIEEYADLLGQLADRTKPKQDYQALQNANPRLVEKLNDIAVETTSLIQELQFGGCLPRVP